MKTIMTTLILFLTCSQWVYAANQSGKVVTVPHHKSTYVKLQGLRAEFRLGIQRFWIL